MNLFAVFFLMIFSQAYAEDLVQLKWQTWENRIPDVVICDGANVDQEAIETAVENWRARGEKIGRIIRKSCGEYPSRNEIGIYENNERVGNGRYGVTTTNVFYDDNHNLTDKILLARIWIKTEHLGSTILLEHELGHALGFKDTSDMNSIMARSGPIY